MCFYKKYTPRNLYVCKVIVTLFVRIADYADYAESALVHLRGTFTEGHRLTHKGGMIAKVLLRVLCVLFLICDTDN